MTSDCVYHSSSGMVHIHRDELRTLLSLLANAQEDLRELREIVEGLPDHLRSPTMRRVAAILDRAPQ